MKKHTALAYLISALLAGSSLHGEPFVTDNFDYGETDGALAGLTTTNTSGWGAAGWSGATTILYQPGQSINLSIAGYVQDASGGRLVGPHVSTGAMVTRSLEDPVNETLFVSFAALGTFWNATLNVLRTMVAVNGTSSNMFGFTSSGGTGGTTPLGAITAGGVSQTTNIAGGAGNTSALGVAKLETNYDGTHDRISFWGYTPGANPDLSGQNLAALGAPLLVAEGANLWGDSISSLGIFLSSPTATDRTAHLDSLRISYGDHLSNDEHVFRVLTAVPEPSTYALLFGAGVLAVALVRRKRIA